jgi:nucleotide-binding universal stress UspA family protein
MELKSILVATDFSAGSLPALREAVRLSRWNNATLRAVHIIDPLVVEELEEALPHHAGRLKDSVIHDAGRAWRELAASVPGLENVLLEVRVQHRVSGVVGYAREVSADLLVMGARGEREGSGVGSVALGCVRSASIDTLLVRPTARSMFTLVMSCIDFSPTSVRGLDFAARLATQDGAALHVVHTFAAPWHQLHYRAPTPEADPHFQREYTEGLQRRLEAVAGSLGRSIDYLKPTFSVIDCPDHRFGIVEHAERLHADLIVLGTRGRTNLRDLFLGSTAENVLAESDCSVLAVRPPVSAQPPQVIADDMPQIRASF